MKFVLKDAHGGGYFAGRCHDRYGCEDVRLADDLADAVVFTATVSEGKLVVGETIPEGDWVPRAVAVAIL